MLSDELHDDTLQKSVRDELADELAEARTHMSAHVCKHARTQASMADLELLHQLKQRLRQESKEKCEPLLLSSFCF